MFFFGKSVSPYCHRAGCQRSCWRRLAHRSRRESQETPPRDHPAGEALQKKIMQVGGIQTAQGH